MKRGLMVICSVLFLLAFDVFVIAGDTTVFEANVLGQIVMISVPDYLYLGNVSKGSESSEVTVNIVNSGNTNIAITPQLVNSSDEVFSNLYFKRIQSESYKIVGNFTFNISAPSSGSTRNGTCYAMLDLTDFQGSLPSGDNLRRADVKFIAVAQ